MKNELVLKVYEEDFETVKKEVTVKAGKIPFGLVRKIMKLLKIEEAKDLNSVVEVIDVIWEDLLKVLRIILPEMEEKDWDYVDTGELVSVLVGMLKHYFKGLINIPTEKNE